MANNLFIYYHIGVYPIAMVLYEKHALLSKILKLTVYNIEICFKTMFKIKNKKYIKKKKLF